MEEERPQLSDLYDFFWFRHHVLLSSPFPAAVSIPEPEVVSAPAAVAAATEGGSSTGATQFPPGQKPALRRTLGYEVTLATSSDSALLACRPVKLHTILSGKEASDEELDEHREAGGRRGCRVETLGARVEEIDGGHSHRERKRRHGERRRRASQDGKSKSLSELEFEELKGFMDLGFTFPEAAESDQRLLSIVPGLRRRASSEEGVTKEAEEVVEGRCPGEPAIARPYLSEAWNLVADYEERSGSAHNHLLRNWRIPATGEGIAMKDNLRSWAHTVASAVR